MSTDCFWCSATVNEDGSCSQCGSTLQRLLDEGHTKSAARRLDLTMNVKKPEAAAVNDENGITSETRQRPA